MSISDVEISKTRNSEDTVGLFITIKQQEKHDHEKILLLLSGLEDVLTVDEI
jgi:putative Mg2+ transporter-C (MgtC) family protein